MNSGEPVAVFPSRSIIEIGDRFLFIGLREPGQDGSTMTVEQPFWLKVVGCTIDGHITIRCQRYNPRTKALFDSSEHKVPYPTAVELVNARIWVHESLTYEVKAEESEA